MSVIRRHKSRLMLGVSFSRCQLDRILGVLRAVQATPSKSKSRR